MSEHPSPADLLTMGEVTARTGVAASALRFYEEKGLIFAERTPGGKRLYRRHMIRRITLLLVARRLGIHLADVGEVFATLPGDRAPSPEDWQRVSRLWKRALESRRRYLEKLEHELIGCIGCGCLSMRACGLLNPDDSLARFGRGPVRLDEAAR